MYGSMYEVAVASVDTGYLVVTVASVDTGYLWLLWPLKIDSLVTFGTVCPLSPW